MSGLTLSRRDRRVLAIGAIVIGGLVAGARGIPALVRARHDAVASARELTAEAARARETVARAREVGDSLRARNARYLALAPALLEGETPTGAAGALSALVSDAAASALVRLGSIQLRVDSAPGSTFSRVGVRADVTGDVEGITSMLAALERGTELLVVRDLAITQPEPGAGDDRAESLRMELFVQGITVRRSRR